MAKRMVRTMATVLDRPRMNRMVVMAFRKLKANQVLPTISLEPLHCSCSLRSPLRPSARAAWIRSLPAACTPSQCQASTELRSHHNVPSYSILELQRILAIGVGGLLSWQISSGEITYLRCDGGCRGPTKRAKYY